MSELREAFPGLFVYWCALCAETESIQSVKLFDIDSAATYAVQHIDDKHKDHEFVIRAIPDWTLARPSRVSGKDTVVLALARGGHVAYLTPDPRPSTTPPD